MKGIPPWVRGLLYVMIVGGCFVSFLVAGRALWLHRTIEEFSPIEGTVTVSEIREHGEDEALALAASYHVGEKAYEATAWMGVEGEGDLSDAELVAAHPVGSTVTVYYDPAHPERSTMSRDVEVMQPIGTALVLVVVTGFVLMRLRQAASG